MRLLKSEFQHQGITVKPHDIRTVIALSPDQILIICHHCSFKIAHLNAFVLRDVFFKCEI